MGPKRTIAPAASGARATRTLSRGSSCNTVSGMGIIPWNKRSAEGSAHFRQGYNLRTQPDVQLLDYHQRFTTQGSWGDTEMKAVVLEGPGQASIRDVRERVASRGRSIASGTHGGAMRKRSEFLPRAQPSGELSAHSRARGSGDHSGPRQCDAPIGKWAPTSRCRLTRTAVGAHRACVEGQMHASSIRRLVCSAMARLPNSSRFPHRDSIAPNLSLKELCLVEPLTVGFHATARGRVTRGRHSGGDWLWRSRLGSGGRGCLPRGNSDRCGPG